MQGDEPLIDPNELKRFITNSLNNPNQIYIAKCKIDKVGYFNKNLPKIVTDQNNNLLYISRANIPSNKLHKFEKSFGQINIYSYPRKILIKKKLKIKNYLMGKLKILKY